MALILTALIYLTSVLALLVVGYFALARYLHGKSRAKFAAQNIDYVQMPSILAQMTGKENFVFQQQRLIEQNGGRRLFGSRFLGTDTIFVASAEIAQQVLSKDFTSFTNRRSFNFQDPVINSFLSVVTDEKWKRLRSIVTPTFSTGALRRMKPRIDDSISTLMRNFEKRLSESAIVNLKEMYGAFTMDTIMQVAFGLKVDSLHDTGNRIVAMAKSTFSQDIKVKALIQFSLLLAAPKLMKLIGFRNEAMDYFKSFSLEIIKSKREALKQNAGSQSAGKANNFLELLLEAEAENEKLEAAEMETESNRAIKFMNNDEMIAQCILFFVAAYDTTTSAISLASHFLALNPDIQERLYLETQSTLRKLAAESGELDQENLDLEKLVTFESLSQFEYLSAVVNETLRLYPPTFVERTASRDTVLETEDGSLRVDVKKGDIVNFPVFTMHRDPSQFPDPERFNPDRFLTKEPTFHKYAYLPFGSGPRNCVAKSLALLEAKMALLNVIHRYRLSPCEQTKIPVQFYNNGQILTPRDVTVRLERR